MNPETILAQIRVPEVRVVYAHRGFGKSRVARRLSDEFSRPWSRRQVDTICVDVEPQEDPEEALHYAVEIDKRLRTKRPGVQVKTFLRWEDWYWLRRLSKFNHLRQYAWEMPPFLLEHDVHDSRFCNVDGNLVPEAMRSGDLWVLGQPECEWLSAALPHAENANRKIAYADATQKLHSYRARHPNTPKTSMSVKEFLDHCEMLRAVKRVGQGSLLWSRLWLEGCRYFRERSA